MRLPRRVPWESLAELDEVCNWIYADEMNTDAKTKAVNRLSAWRVITALPHSLEAALSLLSSIILDEQYSAELQRAHQPNDDRPSSIRAWRSSPALSIRQSYATAIVRLVNGLVDPLQLGTYARSIASIAAQIGFPQWLVELRHAATHEDLPSLELLRAGARESLVWLLHNYFLPTISAPSAEQSGPIVRLTPLTPLLKQYKLLMKIVTRDASLKSQYRDDLAKALRDIERWIGEAKVASSAVNSNGWDAGELNDGDVENERWTLDRICEALLERGGLVPVSSKKRLVSSLKSPPVLPSSLIAIWSPLLSALKANHPTFPAVLVFAISDFLTHRSPIQSGDDSSKKDVSYELCLAAWVVWCFDQWETISSDVQEENTSPVLRRRDAVINLVSTLSIQVEETTERRKGASALLDLLVCSDPVLNDLSKSLFSAAQHNSRIASGDPWKDDDMTVMEDRLNAILASIPREPPVEEIRDPSATMDVDSSLSVAAAVTRESESHIMPKGWTRLPATSWKPCPIGVFVG